jgi:hypothetical protein
MKKQHILLALFICFTISLTPSVKAQNAQLQANIAKLRSQGLTGKRLQDMVLQRAAGLASSNKPYIMDGIGDCWGYVNQVWNAILIDGNVHSEEFVNSTRVQNLCLTESQKKWANTGWGCPNKISGGLLRTDHPNNDWVQITNWNDLAPGVPLASAQGHFGGGTWHGVIHVKEGQQYESTPVSPSGSALRTRDAGMKYYYKPLNDLLKEASGPSFVVCPENSEKQYIIEDGVKHWLMDGNEVAKRGGVGKVQNISKAAMDAIPTGIAYGNTIPTGNYKRIIFKANGDATHTVYVVLDGKKRNLCRLPFTHNGLTYTALDVELVTPAASNAVPTGAVLCDAVQPPANKVYVGSLAAGQSLKVGDILKSPNGAHQLIYQTDGNLVIYRGGAAVWHSHTNGQSAGYCIMQTDGNLVIYNGANQPNWASSTNTCAASSLAMQDDGNLVLYTAAGKAVWNTVTQSNLTNMNSITGQKLCK